MGKTGKILTLVMLMHLVIAPGYADDEESSHRSDFNRNFADNVRVIDNHGHCSSVVYGCVNVITGSYVDSSVDMVIPGPEPVVFERSYISPCNHNDYESHLCSDWKHNHAADIEASVHGYLCRYFPNYFASYVDKSGSKLSYGEQVCRYKDTPCTVKLNLEKSGEGITNSPRMLSGKTNVKNTIIKFDMLKRKNNATVVTGSGSELFFEGETQNNAIPLNYYLVSETKPNGNKLVYNRETRYSQIHFNGRVIATDSTQSTTFGSINWTFESKPGLSGCTHVIGSNGQTVDYDFFDLIFSGQKRRCLAKVRRSDGSDEFFVYEADSYNIFLCKKILPDNRFVEIDYYSKGIDDSFKNPSAEFRYTRVKSIFGPVGVDEKPIAIAQFAYYFDKPSLSAPIGQGYTEVFDAYRHKTTYHYTKEHRLAGIEKFSGTNHYKPYSTRAFYWGDETGPDCTQLIAEAMHDATGQIQWFHGYYYDERGNVLEERMEGNLTGIQTSFCTENYRKFYTYSNDGFNLMLSQEDENAKIYYSYKPHSDLLASKLITDHHDIKERYFYEYDHFGVKIQEIRDDGSAREADDLSGVTERHITRITPTSTQPYGLPQNVVITYLDIATQQEVLIKRTFNTYSQYGYLIRQEVYDSRDQLAYILHWDYDMRGNKILECNALGDTIIRKYDLNNNLIYEQGPHPDHHKTMTYDFANRLIRVDEAHSGNQHSSESFTYDYRGCLCKKVDHHGNITSYVHDDFGRLIQTQAPPVPDETGAIITPKSSISYNVLDVAVETVDAKGYCLKMDNTIRGKPCRIHYPDGTVQSKEYYLNGNLRKEIDRDGTIKQYTYDYKNRLTQTQTLSPTGELLSQTSTAYNAYHPILEIDAAGHETHYRYDGAGYLIERIEGKRHKTLTYDPLGRLYKVFDHYGDQPNQVRCSCREYDLLNRTIEERVEDHQGTILQKVNFKYDVLGNRTHVIQADGATTETVYDSRKRITKTIDPYGNQSHTVYNEHFIDEYGIPVLQILTTDPLGNQAEVIHDSHERPYLFLRRNAFGVLVAKQQIKYDAVGNMIQTIDTAIATGLPDRELLTTREYDGLRRIVTMTEAVGTPEQRITHYSYHNTGKKASTTKPDGNKIFYEYDYLGRLSATYDSFHTFSYRYSYDANHNLIHIEDQLTETSTTRNFDPNNQLIHEELANGVTIDYQYDHMGRPLHVTLPDKTDIHYTYDALFLREIERNSPQQSYKHTYSDYNLSGNLTSSTLPGHAGEISYAYDLLGRLKEQVAPDWTQRQILYDQAGNLISYDLQDTTLATHCSFTYDDNYQLTSEQGPCSHDYAYDSLYNRTSKDGQPYTLNPLNQILEQGNSKYRYDLNGNLIAKIEDDQTVTYAYDGLDRLTSVSKNGQVTRYTYDALNRRLTKEGTEISHTIKYIYTGQDEIGAIQNNTTTELRILGTGKGAEIGATIAIELNQTLYIPIHDKAGNIASLLDAQGRTVQIYHYSVYGEDPLNPITIPNPWRFCSKRHDQETGLVYFGRRYYDPTIGRWITTDPLGYDPGPNLYAYVKNNPFTHMDLYGLSADEETRVLGKADASCGERIDHNEKRLSIFDDRSEDHSSEDSWIMQSIEFIFGAIGTAIEAIGEHLIPIPIIRDVVSSVGRVISGQPFEWNPTYSKPHSSNYHMTDNHTHLPNRLGMYGNGNVNTVLEGHASAELVSKNIGDITIMHSWGSTKGYATDILGCFLLHMGVETHAVRKMVGAIRELLHEVGKDGFVDVFLHSRGGLVFHVAQQLLTPEERKQLCVVTFGSAKIIEPEGFHSAVNFVSTRDPIPFISDPVGCLKGAYRDDGSVVFLKSEETPFMDHAFSSKTYQDALGEYGSRHVERYGPPVAG